MVDNTNVLAAERARFFVPARAAGFTVIGYVFRSTTGVLIARNNRLYTLTFAPWYPAAAGSGQTTPLEHLYETVIKSIHFMPPT